MKQTVNMEMLVNPSIKKVMKANRRQQKEPISKIRLKGNWNLIQDSLLGSVVH